MRGASWAALALLCAAALRPGPAYAQPPDAIGLVVEDCEDVSGASVRELVVLEVAPRAVLSAGSAEAPATRAQLSCRAGVAAITVEEIGRATALHLEIRLSDLARSARPRVLALAIAELIATSRLQRQQPSAAEPEPPASSAPSYEPPAISASSYGAQLWLAVGAARVAQPSMLALLGALGANVYYNALALTADLRFEHAERAEDLAQLRLTAGSLALAPAWRLHASSADLLIGAGVRAGIASLGATATAQRFEGSTVRGLWLAPCAQLALHVRLARRWALHIGIEAAYLTRTLRGLDQDGAALLELRGLALAAQLGVGWDLSDPG